MLVRIEYPPSEAVFRQTPGGFGVWDGVRFAGPASTSAEPLDAWVVFERVEAAATAECDPARTIFIAGEPPSIRPYDRRFLAQFAAVVAPGHAIDHPSFIPCHSAIPWWVGMVLERQPDKTVAACRLGYDRLKQIGVPPKERQISVLCSDKATTDGHRRRLEFVRRLRDHFGDRLDVFGHGFRAVGDKWDAIAPYRYHVVIENSRLPHYWTEKLADAFLAGAYPFYCGCTNVADYFPAGSFSAIDRADPGAAIAAIERSLAADLYAAALPRIREARELVLDRHNLFPMLVDLIRRLPAAGPRRVTLRPESAFTNGVVARARRRIKSAAAQWLKT